MTHSTATPTTTITVKHVDAEPTAGQVSYLLRLLPVEFQGRGIPNRHYIAMVAKAVADAAEATGLERPAEYSGSVAKSGGYHGVVASMITRGEASQIIDHLQT